MKMSIHKDFLERGVDWNICSGKLVKVKLKGVTLINSLVTVRDKKNFKESKKRADVCKR